MQSAPPFLVNENKDSSEPSAAKKRKWGGGATAGS